MTLLFHQNMRVFGGGAAARNAAYQGAFGAMVAGGGPLDPAVHGNIAVAGFTEVTNNGAAANAFSGGGGGGTNLCGALGVNHLANIACGRTALAHGPEYIAIGAHPGVAPISAGRFFFRAGFGGLELLHDQVAWPPPAGWVNQVAAGASLDYRGLVYVVVDLPGGGGPTRIAVGFLHNLYTFEAQRILVMGQIPQMLYRMGEGLAGPPVARYIGGDFNVGVISPRGTARIGYAFAYSQGMPAAPVIPGLPAGYPAFTPGGTLWSGNLYDYWFSDIWAGPPPPPVNAAPAPLITPPVPMTVNTTLNAPTGFGNTMSDHCAIALQI